MALLYDLEVQPWLTQVSLFIKENLSVEGLFKHGWCL